MKVLSYPELKPVFGIRFSRVHLDRLVVAGKFPKPIHLAEQTKGWIDSEIEGWLKSKMAERDVSPDVGA